MVLPKHEVAHPLHARITMFAMDWGKMGGGTFVHSPIMCFWTWLLINMKCLGLTSDLLRWEVDVALPSSPVVTLSRGTQWVDWEPAITQLPFLKLLCSYKGWSWPRLCDKSGDMGKLPFLASQVSESNTSIRGVWLGLTPLGLLDI